MTPLTVPEARAILLADEALQLSFEARLDAGQILGTAEGAAWDKLVESANHRIVGWDRPTIVPPSPSPSPPYPGGNEPDFQTLFGEAIAASEARKAKLSILACREGSSWVVQAIEEDVASQGDSLLGALADLGRMFDVRDHLLATEGDIASNPRAPAEYVRALSEGHLVGVLALGAARDAQVYIGISPFERRTP